VDSSRQQQTEQQIQTNSRQTTYSDNKRFRQTAADSDSRQIQTNNIRFRQTKTDSGRQQHMQQQMQADRTNQTISDAERGKTRQNQTDSESDVTNITR
ncbi:hypothetical protein Tco_1221933, partial [Tanacetum coccineum]